MGLLLDALQEPFRTECCAVHGVSIRGLSHEMSGMPLQDSYAAARLDNGWIVLAVADGVGSEPRAEVGAQIAVTAAVDHLRRFWGFRIDDHSVEMMLHAAYQAACAEIFAQAVRDQAPLREYSTTLHTVIFADGLLYLMHTGDGGVAILTEGGAFKKLTVPMKGADGESVVSLLAGCETWQFSVCRERVQCVVVATDGVWDKLCPPILASYGGGDGVEKSIASFFMSPWARAWKTAPLEDIARREIRVFRGGEDEAIPEFYDTLVSALAQGGEPDEARELVKTRVAPGNMPVRMLRGIKDDITLLSLVRFDPEPEKTPVDQFSPPDWPAIERWVRERLYSDASQEAKREEGKGAEEAAAHEETGTNEPREKKTEAKESD